nr:restriction endonuclease subunit S [Ensifer sp. ENS04]
MFSAQHYAQTVCLAEVTTKITDGAHFTPTYVEQGVPFLRVTDIQEDSIDWETVKRIPKEEHDVLIQRCNPQRGDVLLSKNGTIGITKIVDWDNDFSIFVSLALIKAKPNLLLPEFLESFLSSANAQSQFSKHSKAGTVTNLHLREIRNLQIPVVPLEEQKKWQKLRLELRERMFKLRAAKIEMDNLFRSLQHRAFSGQL